MITQTIQSDWINLEDGVPFDVWDIENNTRKFYLLINYDDDLEEEEVYRRLISARKNVTSATTLLINSLKPEENDYIKKLDTEEKTYRWMIDNFERSQKRLDSIETELFDKIFRSQVVSSKKISSDSKLLIYARTLHEHLEHFVYYPLKKARLNFIKIKIKDKDGKKIVKDEKLFMYLVFCEIFHSSEIFGGLSREEIKAQAKAFGTTNQQPNLLNSPKPPPGIPKNVKTEGNSFEDNSESNLPSFLEEGGEENEIESI